MTDGRLPGYSDGSTLGSTYERVNDISIENTDGAPAEDEIEVAD